MKPRKSLNRLLAGAVGTLLALGFGVIPAQAQTQVSTEVRDIYNMTNNVRSAYGLNTLTVA